MVNGWLNEKFLWEVVVDIFGRIGKEGGWGCVRFLFIIIGDVYDLVICWFCRCLLLLNLFIFFGCVLEVNVIVCGFWFVRIGLVLCVCFFVVWDNWLNRKFLGVGLKKDGCNGEGFWVGGDIEEKLMYFFLFVVNDCFNNVVGCVFWVVWLIEELVNSFFLFVVKDDLNNLVGCIFWGGIFIVYFLGNWLNELILELSCGLVVKIELNIDFFGIVVFVCCEFNLNFFFI